MNAKTNARLTMCICIILSINSIEAIRKIEKFSFSSCDTIKIKGEIWLPDTLVTNKIVINVFPSLDRKMSSDFKQCRKIGFQSILRDKLLKKGVLYFEFAGRNDSIVKYNKTIPLSTMFTKAQDLDAAISYINSRDDLKNKQIILLGASEGGSTSAITASKSTKINAIVLLASPCVNGMTTTDYQHNYGDTLLFGTCASDSKTFDKYWNNASSLKQKPYEHSISGIRKFREDMYEPLEKIVQSYANYDTIAAHVIYYLKEKWAKEDDKTKKEMYKGNIENYYQMHQYLEYIKPQSIALRKWNPDIYFSKIKCPILTVNGTKDKRVEWHSTIENLGKISKNSGRSNLTIFLLKDYNHSMETGKDNLINKDITTNDIINWILKQ